MKYLLFNVAVAAALVFLFTADRGEVQKIAGRVHDAAGDMKAYATKALDTGKTLLDREVAKAEPKAEPAPAAAPPNPPTQPVTKPVTKPVAPSLATPPEPASRPLLPRRLAGNIPAIPKTGSHIINRKSPVALAPEVAKRRREVLDGIDAAAASDAAAPVLKEGTRLMTASERRKELLSLAEEMELLYARSISR